jgi:hypothetical protein
VTSDAKHTASSGQGGAVAARTKSVQLFLLQAAILLLVIGHFPNSTSIYPRIVHAEANLLFGAFGAGRSIAFTGVEPASTADGSDTRMWGMVRGEQTRRWQAVYSIRRRGYWPTAALVAMVLATPMSRRRRAWAVPGAAVLLNIFLMAQLAAFGLCAFGASEPSGPDPGWLRAVSVATRFFNSPVPSYAVVFMLWTLLVRPSAGIDVRRFVGCLAWRRGAR